jgi:hypothetical protein
MPMSRDDVHGGSACTMCAGGIIHVCHPRRQLCAYLCSFFCSPNQKEMQSEPPSILVWVSPARDSLWARLTGQSHMSPLALWSRMTVPLCMTMPRWQPSQPAAQVAAKPAAQPAAVEAIPVAPVEHVQLFRVKFSRHTHPAPCSRHLHRHAWNVQLSHCFSNLHFPPSRILALHNCHPTTSCPFRFARP